MGIPKFYRWTSERYPCLSERIKEYQIPEFDNLYLDMNGIIHNCSHPNDEDIHLRIPEEQIFKDIFRYIEFLFKMIKPCKVFFMAVDGVAPRAKMNQQRGRRFRSARLAEDQEAEAIRKGETLPSEERFDSNCITPGTEFMARLHEQLKYFVQVKVSTDPLWQKSGLVIYLSGHDVPGEGEHKIMDFIRHQRSKPDYEPVRHCLYGLDADLVMLGLSTHELQFSLLREEVKFSRPKKPKNKGVKKTPKQQIDGTAGYDLTNVSIFKFDGNAESAAAVQPIPKTVDSKDASILVDGQSFLNALEKPKVETLPEETKVVAKQESSSANDDDVLPPPPDESKAKGVYRAPLPEKTTFLLLHLSLMRDYIDFEFQDLKKTLENHKVIKYDLEKIIDDWILMNILVGNDFVPHLPHLHIVKGALPMLYQIYSEVLPTLDGYINENGILNLRRFEAFIRKLSLFDIESFRETYDDMKYMESKTGKNIVLGEKMFEGFEFGDDNFKDEEALEPTMSPELKALAQRTEDEVFGEKDEEGDGKLCADLFQDNDDFYEDEDSPELRLEFLQHKRNYYISKLEFEEISNEFLERFCKEYIRAIQWVLLYYYKGVSSWGWFYPFHYAPFCSDLKNFANFSIQFDKGQPFRPFEQLLAVLPAQSKKLLPSCYQWLMTDDKSPILEFYPQKFEQDLNGKKQDWEAVVLIPFIDESKLLTVMENEETNLNIEEAHRNAKGTMMLCSHSKEETGPVVSPRNLFSTLETSHVKIETLEELTYSPEYLPTGIHPKTKKDAIYQGFPTLKSKPVEAVVEKAEIKVFEFATREESMVISLENSPDKTEDILTLSKQLIGRCVWVNWPHLTYALVTGVLTRKGKYVQGIGGKIFRDEDLVESRAEKEFSSIARGVSQRHLKFKGMKLGDLNVIIYAKMMEGRKVRCTSSGEVQFETQWSQLEQPFALKTCMYEENITEIFYLDRALAKSYIELFNKGDQVFYLGDKLFGSVGTVVGHDEAKSSVVVNFSVPTGSLDEDNLKASVGRHTLKSHDYYSSHTAAGKCQISSYVLSRITGSVFISVDKETKAQKRLEARKLAAAAKLSKSKKGVVVVDSTSSSSSEEDFPILEAMRKVNVGLDLKFNKKNLEVRGYTSKRDGQWYYSGKAVQLVNEFVLQFQDLIRFLIRSEKGRDGFDASEIFPNNPLDRINEIVDWLDEKGIRDLPRIPTNTNVLDDDDIDSVWQYITKFKTSSKCPVIKKMSVRPNLLLKPGLDRGCVAPIPNSTYDILDRIVCVDRGAPIVVGHRGTVVGIQVPQASEPEQIEESFKSTGAATLMTLIVLCDPAPDVFDNPEDFILGSEHGGKDNDCDQLSGALVNLLRLSLENKPANPAKSKAKSAAASLANLKPKLVKLYPYQVINLTNGPSALREQHRNIKQLRSLELIDRNGVSTKPTKSSQNEHSSRQNQNFNNNTAQPQFDMQQPFRILQRPQQPPQPAAVSVKVVESSKPVNNNPPSPPKQKQGKNPFTMYDSKAVQRAKAQALLTSIVNANPASSSNSNNSLLNLLGSSSTSSSSAQQKQTKENSPAAPSTTSKQTAKEERSKFQGELPWPPQPLMRINPTSEPFSVAAQEQKELLLQQQSSQQQPQNLPVSNGSTGGFMFPGIPSQRAALPPPFSLATAFQQPPSNPRPVPPPVANTSDVAQQEGQNLLSMLTQARGIHTQNSTNNTKHQQRHHQTDSQQQRYDDNQSQQRRQQQAPHGQRRYEETRNNSRPRRNDNPNSAGPPKPPQKWLANDQYPIPQHHLHHMPPRHLNNLFVPTQVARNQAPRDQQQAQAHQSSPHGSGSRDIGVLNGQQNQQQQAPRVVLPEAVLKVINPPASEMSQIAIASGGQQSRSHQKGKSRIAANFGNNLS